MSLKHLSTATNTHTETTSTTDLLITAIMSTTATMTTITHHVSEGSIGPIDVGLITSTHSMDTMSMVILQLTTQHSTIHTSITLTLIDLTMESLSSSVTDGTMVGTDGTMAGTTTSMVTMVGTMASIAGTMAGVTMHGTMAGVTITDVRRASTMDGQLITTMAGMVTTGLTTTTTDQSSDQEVEDLQVALQLDCVILQELSARETLRHLSQV